ncbi:hypothetical protein Tco_0871662, partial [Tanacetum coccineum]
RMFLGLDILAVLRHINIVVGGAVVTAVYESGSFVVDT